MTRRFIPPISTIPLPPGYTIYDKYVGGVFHAYADAARPNDLGDGRSWASAKKTLAAAVSVLPDAALHPVVLHLKGTFSLTESINIPLILKGAASVFIVDGGDEVVVDAGPYTATGSTVASLTDAARSWAVDQYAGYCLEILDGPQAGKRTTIQSNTADMIVVGVTWSEAPGLAQYRITHPATTITAATDCHFFYTGHTPFDVYFQRLTFDGQVVFGFDKNSIMDCVRIADVVCFNAENGTQRCVNFTGTAQCIASYRKRDPDVPENYLPDDQVGLSVLGGFAVIKQSHVIFVGPNVVRYGVVSERCGHFQLGEGTWVQSITCLDFSKVTVGYDVAYGVKPLIGGSSSVGILARCALVEIHSDVSIADCALHGIQLDQSVLECHAAILSGTGNGGVGVYLKNRSSVLFKASYTPIIEGVLGEVSFTGVTQEATWLEVATGNPVADLTTLSNVQEVS